MSHRFRSLLGAVSVVATSVALMGGAAAAQADCVTNNTSSPCKWDFSSWSEGQNSPNMYDEPGGSYGNKIAVQPTNTEYFTAYMMGAGGVWEKCGQESYVLNTGVTVLCSGVATNELFHVLMNTGTYNWTTIYF